MIGYGLTEQEKIFWDYFEWRTLREGNSNVELINFLVPYPIIYDPAKRKLYMHEKFKALRNFALNNEPIKITYGNQKS